MVGNSAAAAICTISGMTALGIKCNKADCKRRGRGTERGNKRELVRLVDDLGGKKGEWVTVLTFLPKRRGENATHIHTNLRAKVSYREPSEVCWLFSQEWLRRAQTYVFHLLIFYIRTLQSNTASHRSLSIGPSGLGLRKSPPKGERAVIYVSYPKKSAL